MELARIISTNQVEIVACTPQEGARMAQLRNAGFLEYVQMDQPTTQAGKVGVDSYEKRDGKVYQSWSIIEDAAYYQALVAEKKAFLDASDYKIIKCYEATLAGEPLPYDFESLRTERQALRDEINRFESFIQSINL